MWHIAIINRCSNWNELVWWGKADLKCLRLPQDSPVACCFSFSSPSLSPPIFPLNAPTPSVHFHSLLAFSSHSKPTSCSHVFPKSSQSSSISSHPFPLAFSASLHPLPPSTSILLPLPFGPQWDCWTHAATCWAPPEPSQNKEPIEPSRDIMGRLWQHRRWSHEVAKQLITTTPSSSCTKCACTVLVLLRKVRENEGVCKHAWLSFHSLQRVCTYLRACGRTKSF